jgi:hypothetical protein
LRQDERHREGGRHAFNENGCDADELFIEQPDDLPVRTCDELLPLIFGSVLYLRIRRAERARAGRKRVKPDIPELLPV